MQADIEEQDYNEEPRGESEGSYRENAKADPESSMLDYVEDEEEELLDDFCRFFGVSGFSFSRST